VITGTSSGIGEDAAKFFANKGWTVFAGVRKEADAERLRNCDPNIKPLILDVTDQKQVDKAFEEVRVAVGSDGLDALVNNAGFSYMGPVEILPLSKVQKQFDVNVFGVIRVTQAALPLLRIGPPGRIVNVSSVASEAPGPLTGFYSGSKAALDCISESLRRELADWGIKVSVLKPGPVDTKTMDKTIAEVRDTQEAFPVGSKGYDLYGKLMQAVPSAFEKGKKGGMASTSVTSSVIYSAITVRNPRNFYWDTWRSWFMTCIAGLLPTWMADKAIRSYFYD